MNVEKVAQLGAILEKWCADGYPYLAGEEQTVAEDVFRELYQMQANGDAAARQAMGFLGSKVSKPELTDFDLKGYFSGMVSRLGFTDKQCELFGEHLGSAEIYTTVPMERLTRSFALREVCDVETSKAYQARAEKILDSIVQAPSEPNQTLAKILAGNPVVFSFEKNEHPDASMSSVYVDGKVRPLMEIQSGLMNADKVDDNELAFTIAHELGHWIDFSGRPENYFGREKLWQECFADMVGYKMAKNAGYDMSFAVEKRKIMAKEQRAYCKAENKPLPEKTIFEKRVELLEQAFGNDETSKSNMVMINRLSGLKKER